MDMNCYKYGKLGHFSIQCYTKQNFHQGHFPKKQTSSVKNIWKEKRKYLDQLEVTQKEIEEQEVYEEQAEYQKHEKNSNLYEEEDKTEQYTAY